MAAVVGKVSPLIMQDFPQNGLTVQASKLVHRETELVHKNDQHISSFYCT